MSRREVADVLGVHQDSVSRLLADGLGSAVIAFGGRSKPMQFSPAMVRRWQLARECRQRGRACARCRTVLEDAEVVAAHFLEAHHGLAGPFGCDDDCLRVEWNLCEPCGW